MIKQITIVGQPAITVAATAVAANFGVQCTGLSRFSANSLQWADGTIILTDGNGMPPVLIRSIKEGELTTHPIIHINSAKVADRIVMPTIHEWVCCNNIEILNIIGDNGIPSMKDFHSTLFIVRGLILAGMAKKQQDSTTIKGRTINRSHGQSYLIPEKIGVSSVI